MSEVLLPKDPPLLEPDRVRAVIDETNVTVRDLREAFWLLVKATIQAEVDKGEAAQKTLRRMAREHAHLSDLYRLRTRA